MACDLHAHSDCSDGTFTPAELVEEACRAGLSAVALTDHNSINGIEEFLKAAEGKPLLAIPGVEFSTDCFGTELHLTGLFLPRGALSAVRSYAAPYLQRKELSNRLICERLTAAGYDVSYDRIAAENPKSELNRSHFAGELVKLGAFQSIREATQTLLEPGQGIYEPPERLDVTETIRFVRSLGAVPVLAHPFLNPEQRAAAERRLPEMKEAGLMGIETDYVTYTPEQTAEVRLLARKYGLLPSGGSDFHGGRKPRIALGTGYGSLCVPDSYAEALREAAERLRSAG